MSVFNVVVLKQKRYRIVGSEFQEVVKLLQRLQVGAGVRGFGAVRGEGKGNLMEFLCGKIRNRLVGAWRRAIWTGSPLPPPT